ncbi:DUF3794 domain-containing protein [Halanaerobaculum tunisiense]
MNSLNDLVEVVGVADSFPELDGEGDYWTQMSIPETLTIPQQKPDIEQIAKVVVKVKIMSQRVVKTPVSCGCNLAGSNLTGKKLIIEGFLKQKLLYVADIPQQSVHVAHFKVPFSTYIIVPGETSLQAKFRVDPYIEDVFIKLETARSFFKNVTLFLHAIPTDCQYC